MKKTTVKVPRLTKPTTAYKLLDKVCDLILEEPKRYNQRVWQSVLTPEDLDKDRFPQCGTMCCIAGWINVLRGDTAGDHSTPNRAAEALGFPHDDDDPRFSDMYVLRVIFWTRIADQSAYRYETVCQSWGQAHQNISKEKRQTTESHARKASFHSCPVGCGGRAMSHTPGPWQVSPLDGRTCGPSRLLVSSGTEIRQMQAVAIVTLRTGETNANARLIAASTELFAAAKAAVAFLDAIEWNDTTSEHDGANVQHTLEAALAKAEGR